MRLYLHESSVMNRPRIVYYSYCLFVLSAPAQGVYLSVIETVALLLSFPQFWLFRAYISSGPPASKTVLHALLVPLTYGYQLVLGIDRY